MLIRCPHCRDETQQDMVLERFTCGACDEPFDGKAAIVWPPLAQPFTDNLMDEILRSMSDEELERLTAKNLPGEAGRRPAVSRRRMAHSGTADRRMDEDDLV